jgi:hypothetical protein
MKSAEKLLLETEWDEEASQQSAMVQHTGQEVLQAHAALLDNVIVARHTDEEAFRLVKGHIRLLEQWHEQHTGWRIQRGSNFFRLERHLHQALPVFLDEKLKEARDFACLAWILWFAEKRYLAGSGRHQQFLLSELTEEIQRQTQEMNQRRVGHPQRSGSLQHAPFAGISGQPGLLAGVGRGD